MRLKCTFWAATLLLGLACRTSEQASKDSNPAVRRLDVKAHFTNEMTQQEVSNILLDATKAVAQKDGAEDVS